MKKSSKISLTVLLILAMCFNILSPVFATTPQNATDTVDAIQQDAAEPQSSEDEALPEVLQAEKKTDAAEEIQNTENAAPPEALLEDVSAQVESEKAVPIETSLSEIRSRPSESVFNKLWVGGFIRFFYANYEGSGFEHSVLAGDGVEYKNTPSGVGLFFAKGGKKTVKIAFKKGNETIAEKTYDFSVAERPENKKIEVNYKTPESIKIGDSIRDKTRYTVSNLNYGIYACIDSGIDFKNGLGHFTLGHQGDFYFGGLFPFNDDRTVEGPGFKYHYGTAYRPGESDLSQVYQHIDTEETFSAPDTQKIEEPIITDNAPQKIAEETTLDLKTELTNLNVKDQKISNFTPQKDIYISDVPAFAPEHEIGYKPTVEVVEGKELVEQNNQDYTNTLSTNEKLTFKGTGTVKLKIRYEQINTCTLCMFSEEDGKEHRIKDNRYHPEKTITINVVESPVKSIVLKTNPTQMEYVEGTVFNPKGGVLSVTYNNGTVKDVALDSKDVTCTTDLSKPLDSAPVIVNYEGITTTFNIKVTPKSLEKIAVTKDPQTQYLTGDTLNLKDGELTLTYNNGTTQALALTDKDVVVTGYDKDKVGQQTLTITYKEKTAPLKVEVISREALNKVIEMINKIDPDNLYESDRAMVYDAKNAYDKLGTDIEKAAVTNVEILNKAVALFEAPFYSEAVVNNTTITAKGDSNIFALRTRLVAKGSTLSTEHQQGVLKTLNNNPQLIDAYDFSYAYVEKDGKDQLAVLAKDKTLQYTLPLDTNIVGKKAVNVVYINAKGEPTVLKSDYQNGVLSFESGQVGIFALILTDLPAPVDPTNPNGGSTNASTNGNNPITGLFNSDNAVQSVVVLCVVLLACTSAFISKKKQQ